MLISIYFHFSNGSAGGMVASRKVLAEPYSRVRGCIFYLNGTVPPSAQPHHFVRDK